MTAVERPDPGRPDGRAAQDYDQAYFDHWYRDEGFDSPMHLARRVGFGVAAAEYLLGRPVRSVLDVGCGEGPWQPVLAELRPAASYLGIDPSAYAVARYGAERNLRQGSFGQLDQALAPDEGPFDLIVCVDVMGYVADAELPAGLVAIAQRLGGVALLEVFTTDDDFEGDVEHYRRRSPARYRRWFDDAGLARIGPNLFIGTAIATTLSTFESPLAT